MIKLAQRVIFDAKESDSAPAVAKNATAESISVAISNN